MPTPRAHGGAPLTHFPLTVPGFKGLNTESKGSFLGPEWATKLENTILDSQSRVTSRKGYLDSTTTPFSAAFISGIEHRGLSSVKLLATTATKVALSADNGDTWSDVTGTASFTSGTWHLVNFNGYTLGFQSGKKILVFNGATSSHVADANCPQGGAGTAAFGRVWAFDSDGVTLKYSVLLNHTDFTGAGSGSFNLSNVWPDTDFGTAVAAYNNNLVIFGSRNIVIMSDGTGSTIGLNPTNARVIDTIPGIGCLAQDSIQFIDGDIWFVSNSRNLMSLKRVLLEQKAGDLTCLSKNVSSSLRDAIDSGSFLTARMHSTYSPSDRFYLLSLPTESSAGAGDEVGKVFAFDTVQPLEDGSARCIGVWNQMVPTVFFQRADNTLYMAINTSTGQVGKYSGYTDNSVTFGMSYESGWLDVTQGTGYELILKRLDGIFLFDSSPSALLKWAFDFSSTFKTRAITFTSTGATAAEYGIAEYNVGEWGGGVSLGTKRVSGAGTGQFIKVGLDATINGGAFSIQQLDLFAKIGRLVG